MAFLDHIVALGVNARGDEVPVAVSEFISNRSAADGDGAWVLPVLSRPSADASWQHHQAPAFVAEMARRGVTFDPSKLASLARP